MIYSKIKNELNKFADKKQAKNLQRYFKTGKGQYGEGDIFLGLRAAEIKSVARKYYKTADLDIVQKLLRSTCHEYRVLALRILTYKFTKADETEQKNIYTFYLKNTTRINNWDLVDLSAPNIVGIWLLKHNRKILYKLAHSKNLWERRIAIISTFAFIRAGKIEDTIKISKILLNDSHDLIHKAVGWMLREVGKKKLSALEQFLKTHHMSPRDRNHRVLNPHISSSARKCKNSVFPLHSPAFAYKKIPRTTLRYAIEKFPETKRKKYLKMRA